MALDPSAIATTPQFAPLADESTDGRQTVHARIKPNHLAWLEARAAAHGQTLEAHLAGIIAAAWQTDTWRTQQLPEHVARPKA